jgi:hypothetical protein
VTHSIYLARSADGEVLYIGQTSRRDRRVDEHAKSSPWWSRAAAIELQHFATALECDAAERRLIRRHRPPFNTTFLHRAPQPSTGDLPELVTAADIGRRLGVSRQRVAKLAARNDFPHPLGRLGNYVIFLWEDVADWARTTGRLTEAQAGQAA